MYPNFINSIMISMKFKEDLFSEQKYFSGTMLLVAPNHNFLSFGGLWAVISATILFRNVV